MMKELAEILEKAQEEARHWKMMAGLRVPKRDHDAVLKSMSVCQATIERLMIALYKLKPNHPEVADARIILGLLEHLIQNNPLMQDEGWEARKKAHAEELKAKAEAIKAQRMKRPAEMLGERAAFEDSFEERALNRKKVKGTVKKEYKE